MVGRKEIKNWIVKGIRAIANIK